MPNPSYAALLREVASCLDDGPLAGVPRPADEQAAQLRTLADLLDRVTPERVERGIHYAGLESDTNWTLCRDLLRALAAGPQPEEGRADG